MYDKNPTLFRFLLFIDLTILYFNSVFNHINDFKIHPDNPNPRKISQVIECLRDGGIIVYPSDTVYGIGCDIFNKNL